VVHNVFAFAGQTTKNALIVFRSSHLANRARRQSYIRFDNRQAKDPIVRRKSDFFHFDPILLQLYTQFGADKPIEIFTNKELLVPFSAIYQALKYNVEELFVGLQLQLNLAI
jgi:hypothetical protein